ncbi:glycosyltransferase 87 family protein [Amycolatopsis anabasis]|uniref:glycosyltransferase 87 family protein n=1 Tax=Amycolatopsis anabasis TaxID=1840409 RepID=UPI00131AE80B|nr:glycosyltransferase 87 family protein [Amycolatopsis anabasis]
MISQRWRVFAVIGLVLVAAAVRVPALGYESGDYVGFVHRWYEFIQQHGGFAALRYNFANYNAPYLYLLAAASYLPLSPLLAVKLISLVFDAVLGWFAYRLLTLRYPSGWLPFAGAAVVVLLPTVVLNGAMWAQADSIYAAFAVGGVYYLLRRKPWWACAFFGFALAFKLQVVFLFPLLLLLALRRWLPWRALLAIPGVYLLLDVPALLLGANPRDLLLIYLNQAETYDQLSLNAPTAYQYLAVTKSDLLRSAGILVTGAVVLGLIGMLVLRRAELTATRIVLAATVSVLLVPFLLPSMHDRYFYLADVFTVAAAFWLPRRLWFVPILTQFASLFSYLPFLLLPQRIRDLGGARPPDLHTLFAPVVDFRILATAILVALIATLAVTTRTFRGDQRFQQS